MPSTQRVMRASNIRVLPYVPATIALIVGCVLLGTGLNSLFQSRALVAELRAHSAVARATVASGPADQTGTPQASFGFALPGGKLALTDDTQFDGTFSVPPPSGNATVSVIVRYDPANVNVVLPESIVGHPSYGRVTQQAVLGGGIAIVALAFWIWWWRHERRWRAARDTLFKAAFVSDVLRRAHPQAAPDHGATGTASPGDFSS